MTKDSSACKEARTSNFLHEPKVVVLVEAPSEKGEGEGEQQGQAHFDIMPFQNHILLFQRAFAAMKYQIALVVLLQNSEQRKR